MIIACPAKLNLTLEILNRRDDGYHLMRSVVVPLAFCDELEIELATDFSFRCSDPALESEVNLVVRAVRSLDSKPPVAVSLQKNIPSQAGLGGGSSDAAALLRAAMRGALGTRYVADWVSIARSLGSDVPFFLVESGALVEGTGERVTAVGALPPWHVLIIKPPVAVSTAAAYAELDKHQRPSRPRNDSVSIRVLTALQRGDFSAVESDLSNDFHDVIAEATPEVANAIDGLRRAGASAVLLAGSGSAVFALARDARTIAEIDDRLELDETYQRFVTHLTAGDPWR